MLSDALDRIFGAKLLSGKAIATSVGLSIASYYLSLYSSSNFFIGSEFHHSNVALCMFIVSILLAVSPGKLRYATFPWILLVSVEMYMQGTGYFDNGRLGYTIQGYNIPFWDFVRVNNSARITLPYVIIGMVFGGLLCDIGVIALLRWLLSKASALRSTWKLLGFVLLQICIGTAVVAPVLLIRYTEDNESDILRTLFLLVIPMAYSNLVTALVAFLIVLLLFLALLHHVTWPVLSRPIYAAQRLGLVSNPKLLAGLSGTLLLLAWPHNPVVTFLARIMGHGG
jgi:hypothetical protein